MLIRLEERCLPDPQLLSSMDPPNALKFCCSAGRSQDTPTGRHDKRDRVQWRPYDKLSIKAESSAVAASSNFLLGGVDEVIGCRFLTVREWANLVCEETDECSTQSSPPTANVPGKVCLREWQDADVRSGIANRVLSMRS